MARRIFWSYVGHWLRNPTDGNPLANQPVTLWTQQTGGTQVTDLQYVTVAGALAGAISGGILATDAQGYLPSFAGPDDGSSNLWADAGSTRHALTVDTFVSAPGGTSGRSWFDVKLDYSAVGDGVAADDAAIQAALTQCLTNGGGWVYVPPGDYALQNPLRIYRNTRLTLSQDARIFRANGSMTRLLTNGDSGQSFGGYTGHGNIVIEGGTWDVVGGTLTGNCNGFSIGHAEGVFIRDLVMKNINGFHAIEINSTKTCRIVDCRFLGYRDEVGDRDFSEAIQFDLAKGSGYFGPFGPYDHTPCEDVEVRGCYFGASGTANTTPWPRGVGSHSATITKWHRRVRILGCTFDTLSQWAIGGYNWEEVVVAGNNIVGCGAGIRMRVVDSTDTNDTLDTTGTQTSASQNVEGTIIANNTIRDLTGYDDAIAVRGEATGRSQRVAVTGNTIDNSTGSAQPGIYLAYVERGQITGNLIFSQTGAGIDAQNLLTVTITGNTVVTPGVSGISIDASTDVHASGNLVRRASNYGIVVTGGGEISIMHNHVRGSSSATNSGFAHIRCSTSTAGIAIIGNRCRKEGSGNEADYGISITNTVTGVRRYGNDITGAGNTGTVLDNSTAPSTSTADG